jgi:hypothetical protein
MKPLGINRELKTAAAAKFSAASLSATTNSEGLNVQGMASIGTAVDVSAASGTWDITLQMSFDGGTTWMDTFPDDFNSGTQAALASITGATEASEYWIVPFPAEQDPDAAKVVQVRFVLTETSAGSITFTRWQVWTKEF